MLTSYATPERSASPNFLEGQVAFSHPRLSNNRSVMPLDVRGCTRATLTGSACAYPTPAGAGNPLNPIRDGDRGLQLFPMNEEFPVSAGHKLALIKSLPFVHTARRYYRLDGLVRPSDRPRRGRPTALAAVHMPAIRGRNSRICFSIFSALVPAASADTLTSGFRRTTSSVCVPMEPVEPNIAIFFIHFSLLSA